MENNSYYLWEEGGEKPPDRSRAYDREHSIHWLQCVGLILVLNGTYAACSRILYVVHFVAIQSVKQDEAVKRERTRGKKGDVRKEGALLHRK